MRRNRASVERTRANNVRKGIPRIPCSSTAPAALVIPWPGPGRQARRNLGRGRPNGRFATPRDDGSTVDLLFVFEPVPHHLYPVGGGFPDWQRTGFNHGRSCSGCVELQESCDGHQRLIIDVCVGGPGTKASAVRWTPRRLGSSRLCW